MGEPTWEAVDQFFIHTVAAQDAALEQALRDADAAGLPSVSVTAPQGKLLHLLARLCGARKILEIGTLAGYSAIWMARALPAGGRLISLEANPKHAEVARANLDRAGLAGVVEVRVGAALETLPLLGPEGPFDLVFIDADKPNNPAYFRRALELSRPGTVIVIDNVVRGGAVADAGTTDASAQGGRRVVEMVAAESRVSATALQTVGGKGHDGFVLALVNG